MPGTLSESTKNTVSILLIKSVFIVSVKFNAGAWTDILYQLNLDARNFIKNNQEYCLSIVANNTKLSDVRKHYILSLTFCMLGNFSCFCCRRLIFFKLTFSKKYFKNTIRVLNDLNPDQDQRSVGPDMGPN